MGALKVVVATKAVTADGVSLNTCGNCSHSEPRRRNHQLVTRLDILTAVVIVVVVCFFGCVVLTSNAINAAIMAFVLVWFGFGGQIL